ncbi:unnamed protein product, partial [Didymodactylos carnosus]
QMNIGVMLLAEQILSQYDDFLQQYRAVYQQLHQIQRVDVNQLATGLEIRSVQIANLRSTINRIINEQRFHQRLVASQRRAEALMEMPQEELSKSLLDRQNVEILKENLYKQAWRKFQTENNLVDVEIIEEFNNKPSEASLLITGDYFLEKLEAIIVAHTVEEMSLKAKISSFIFTYLYNLQQADYNLEGWRYLEDQNRTLEKILINCNSLENSHTLDLLIEFTKGMQRECLRHYWFI